MEPVPRERACSASARRERRLRRQAARAQGASAEAGSPWPRRGPSGVNYGGTGSGTGSGGPLFGAGDGANDHGPAFGNGTGSPTASILTDPTSSASVSPPGGASGPGSSNGMTASPLAPRPSPLISASGPGSSSGMTGPGGQACAGRRTGGPPTREWSTLRLCHPGLGQGDSRWYGSRPRQWRVWNRWHGVNPGSLRQRDHRVGSTRSGQQQCGDSPGRRDGSGTPGGAPCFGRPEHQAGGLWLRGSAGRERSGTATAPPPQGVRRAPRETRTPGRPTLATRLLRAQMALPKDPREAARLLAPGTQARPTPRAHPIRLLAAASDPWGRMREESRRSSRRPVYRAILRQRRPSVQPGRRRCS